MVADTFELPDELPGGHVQEINRVICISADGKGKYS